jgi:hypothetical protein
MSLLLEVKQLGKEENKNLTEELKFRIGELKKTHYQQRIQLELTFETTPRDSRYSNGLLELMKKEEQVMKDPHCAAAKAIVLKVDDALRCETQFFFAKSAQQNTRRWLSLNEKLTKERLQLLDEFCRTSSKPANLDRNCCTEISATSTTTFDLELEAERLEFDYNLNWFSYENFNLQQAFKSQNARVENDWSCHEAALVDDFRGRKEKITGVKCDTNPNININNYDQRWQHPEKQKTLIHSAPVLTPTRQDTNFSNDCGIGLVRGKKDLEVSNMYFIVL